MDQNVKDRKLVVIYSSTADKKAKKKWTSNRPPSKVQDPSGPTPELIEEDPDIIRAEDMPEMQYNETNIPVPHQPWRRGMTAGCEDPIDAAWRQRAEDIIYEAAASVGGRVIDCAWYLTSLVLIIDDDWSLVENPPWLEPGPAIDVKNRFSPIWYDPEDPKPKPIGDEHLNETAWERDIDAELARQERTLARKQEDDEDEGISDKEILSYKNFRNEKYIDYESHDTRQEDAVFDMEYQFDHGEKKLGNAALKVDTTAISIICKAIIDALQEEEDELEVLCRHEIVLTSPSDPSFLEGQKQFDAFRGFDVEVQTHDPWGSNRTLYGKLVDRNSMDVYISQEGRLVTIPLNFVKCVLLQQTPEIKAAIEAEKERLDNEGKYSNKRRRELTARTRRSIAKKFGTGEEDVDDGEKDVDDDGDNDDDYDYDDDE